MFRAEKPVFRDLGMWVDAKCGSEMVGLRYTGHHGLEGRGLDDSRGRGSHRKLQSNRGAAYDIWKTHSGLGVRFLHPAQECPKSLLL